MHERTVETEMYDLGQALSRARGRNMAQRQQLVAANRQLEQAQRRVNELEAELADLRLELQELRGSPPPPADFTRPR